MITTLLHLLRLFPFLCGGHRQLALENLALRHQLAVGTVQTSRETRSRTWLARNVRQAWDGGACLGWNLWRGRSRLFQTGWSTSAPRG